MFNKEKGSIKNFIISFLLLALIGGVFWYFNQNQDGEISIESDFGSKIVYTTNTDQETKKFIEHCGNLGGVFKECGTTCKPDADMCATVCAFTCEEIDQKESEEEKELILSRYFNEGFDFSLKYPKEDWNNYEKDSSNLSSKFNFYLKPSGIPLDLPLDHLANVSNVSVFPEGVATEGLFGKTKEIDSDFGFEVTDDSKIYILEDGTPFAAYLKPKNYPESWTEDGFVWMRLRVDDLETKCLKDGEEIQGECNPLTDNVEVVQTGSVNQDLWSQEKEIIKTFQFLNESMKGEELLLEGLDGKIESPLTIKGAVSGSWYFEGSFPVVLTDWDGRIIAETNAEAQEDWMTEDFVPFEINLKFDKPYEEGASDFMKKGNLIFEKANASGKPENSDAYEIRVEFK